MDVLSGKMTDLAYEFFGVLVPGVIASIFLIALWGALGPVVEVWSGSLIPTLTPELLRQIANEVATGISWITAASLFVFWYFVGHGLNWLSRVRSGKTGSPDTRLRRAHALLTLRIPKHAHSYDPALHRLFELVSKELAVDGTPLVWREFYPVTKCLLQQKLKHSLVMTYQNKYTLHRSITAGLVWLFWLSTLSLLGAIVSRCLGITAAPQWTFLGALIVGSAIAAMGFCSSYLYAWRMFGDTVITEAYALLFGKGDATN